MFIECFILPDDCNEQTIVFLLTHSLELSEDNHHVCSALFGSKCTLIFWEDIIGNRGDPCARQHRPLNTGDHLNVVSGKTNSPRSQIGNRGDPYVRQHRPLNTVDHLNVVSGKTNSPRSQIRVFYHLLGAFRHEVQGTHQQKPTL